MSDDKPFQLTPENLKEAGDKLREEKPVSAIPPKGHREKPWGMSREDFAKFMSLVCMGLERADNRQRYLFKKVLKPIIRELRVRYPHGRPIEDIKKEIAEHEQKIKLVIPQGINPETLKEKK